MSTTELDFLEALLARVLTDPRGFAERVFQQMVERVAPEYQGSEPSGALGVHDSTGDEMLGDRNALLAAAVGACDCWGQEPDCPMCSGDGSAGWVQPDAHLYAEYVDPAVQRSAEFRSAGNGTNPPTTTGPTTTGEPQ